MASTVLDVGDLLGSSQKSSVSFVAEGRTGLELFDVWTCVLNQVVSSPDPGNP